MMDLKQMMDTLTLMECQKEIEQQFASIATHDNQMKRAVLLCFLGEVVLKELAKENAEKFIDELKAYLDKIITTSNSDKNKFLMLHVRENGEIVKNIDTISDELREISEKVNSLMTDYDNRLRDIIKNRDNLPVCKL